MPPAAGRLVFLGDPAGLKQAGAFARHLAPLRRKDWFVDAKPPFAGPKPVLAYLSRYTHRVAIANSRLIAATDEGVTFRVKDYRRIGRERYRTMTLPPPSSSAASSPRPAEGLPPHPCSPAPPARPTSPGLANSSACPKRNPASRPKRPLRRATTGHHARAAAAA